MVIAKKIEAPSALEMGRRKVKRLWRGTVLVFLLAGILVQFSALDYFSALKGEFLVSQWFIAMSVAGFMLLFPRVPLNRKVTLVISLLTLLFLLNFVLAYERVPKVMLTQIIYLVTAWYVACLYSSLGQSDLETLFCHTRPLIRLTVIIVGVLAIWLLLFHNKLLSDAFVTFDFNSYVNQLVPLFWMKNHVAYMTVIVILFYFVSGLRKSWQRIGALIWFVPVSLMNIAARGMWVGLFLVMLFILIRKPRILLILLVVGALGLGVLTTQQNTITENGLKFIQFDRASSYSMAVYFASNYPFGLGNGAYHLYTLANKGQLTEQFRDQFSGFQDWLFTAPETNFVFLLGSLGLFGVVVAILLLWVLFRLWRLYPVLDPLDRFWCLLYAFFFLSGIAYNNIVSPSFWIIFGFALGIITARRNQVGGSARLNVS